MKFDWSYYINNLLKRSDEEEVNLKNYASLIVEKFDLLDGEFIYGLRELSTPEYGYWLVNNGIDSLLDYSKDTKTLSRSVVVKDNVDSRLYNNVFDIKNNISEYFKVYDNSLVKVTMIASPNLNASPSLILNIRIYKDVIELLNTVIRNFKSENVEREWQYYDKIVHENLKKIGNARLFDIDVRTLNTILNSLKLTPDIKLEYDEVSNANNIENASISEFINKEIQENLPKVKTK